MASSSTTERLIAIYTVHMSLTGRCQARFLAWPERLLAGRAPAQIAGPRRALIACAKRSRPSKVRFDGVRNSLSKLPASAP